MDNLLTAARVLLIRRDRGWSRDRVVEKVWLDVARAIPGFWEGRRYLGGFTNPDATTPLPRTEEI